MGGAQPLAVTMNDGVAIVIEVDPDKIERRIRMEYCDVKTESIDEALSIAKDARDDQRALSIALQGNAADILPDLVSREFTPDILTDQDFSA